PKACARPRKRSASCSISQASPISSKSRPRSSNRTCVRYCAMMPDAAPRRPSEKLPDWFPPWAAQLADLYFSGTTAAFVLRANIMAAEEDRLSVAVIMDQASYLFPSGEPGRLNLQASSELVTMLNWAMSPHVKRLNMAFVLVDEKLADLSDRLTGNPHVATIEVPLPGEKE